jgi:uncharacterized YigZ family protein
LESYKTIAERATFEYEDRKSVFIGDAAPVSTEAEAIAFIDKIKKKYPDARHHVYAYVLRENSIMRFSDDREPQGTAGMPVLDAIRKNGCTDTVIVVTRYFGGTLLGTGGLVRAYSAAAVGALKEAEIITYDTYVSYEVELSYSDYQKLSAELPKFGAIVDGTDFSDDVVLRFALKQGQTADLLAKVQEMSAGKIVPEVTGTRFDYR